MLRPSGDPARIYGLNDLVIPFLQYIPLPFQSYGPREEPIAISIWSPTSWNGSYIIRVNVSSAPTIPFEVTRDHHPQRGSGYYVEIKEDIHMLWRTYFEPSILEVLSETGHIREGAGEYYYIFSPNEMSIVRNAFKYHRNYEQIQPDWSAPTNAALYYYISRVLLPPLYLRLVPLVKNFRSYVEKLIREGKMKWPWIWNKLSGLISRSESIIDTYPMINSTIVINLDPQPPVSTGVTPQPALPSDTTSQVPSTGTQLSTPDVEQATPSTPTTSFPPPPVSEAKPDFTQWLILGIVGVLIILLVIKK